MEITLKNAGRSWEDNPHATLTRGIEWGLMGGVAGMLVVDLLLMGALSIVGLPPLGCFSMVGNTMRRFFLIMGLDTTGGVPMGVATHYLVGPALGAIFGAALIQRGALRVVTLKKHIALAVLYAEIVSQPLFAMIPLLMKMTAPETVVWFIGSVVMHFLWGIVLGVIVGLGLHLGISSNHRALGIQL